MVGMVIGLLGIIVIMQMYSVFEQQKRTTTSGDEAQNSGAIALHGMQRHLRQSGYGISAYNLIGCNVVLPTGNTIPLAPVIINPAAAIIPAGDANTDTLLVAYGNSNGSTEGDTITQQTDNTHYQVTAPAAFSSGARVIAEPETRPAPCVLRLDSVNGNPTATTVAVTLGQADVSNGRLFNLGLAPWIRAYRIHNGNLTECDYRVNNCSAATEAFWVPIASDIVSLRAQYGRDTVTPAPAGRASYVVNTYDQTTPTTNCGWARAPAVRIALVARGVARGTVATTAAPTWAGSADTPIVLTADTNWQRYHYKVFETTVPLRNVTWMGVQTGC